MYLAKPLPGGQLGAGAAAQPVAVKKVSQPATRGAREQQPCLMLRPIV